MVIDDNRKRMDLLPRQNIPEAWACKARCPLCATNTLKLIHLSSGPDYLLCPPCELSFEIEANSGFIRLKHIPDALGFMEADLRYNWIHPAILRTSIETRKSAMEKKAPPLPMPTLSDQVVWERMLGLFRLGNKPKMIELTLLQSGATGEQIEAAALKLREWSIREQKQQTSKLWMIVGVIVLIMISLFSVGWFFTDRQINDQLSQERGNPAAAGQPNLPLQILNNLPDAIKPEFLKGSPVRVENVGPERARCPRNSIAAAQLFGGDGGSWQPGSQPDSWQMIATDKPSTIRIPKGMAAGYIDNKTFVFTSADGPATIHNVNFVAISCP